ncbi:enoyl-CoA hydratase-related protein [Paracoccus sp. Z330]|uniref:Enoyl-CoA hydratase-related protein n=1 Tax=Paracoccus onchidii TaxID=3017813 RepID=A0ABT4ZGB6_9RHOB|nr:enoyl-CoA hydratase-related protein [Paracoccus onchidii]MDB6178409.1 enoyl-CoA hydratase-related protein [Paracoccus onchidii]
METSQDIVTEVDDKGIMTVTLNRPGKKNAMRLAMWQRLGEIFREASAKAGITGVILTGAGGNFCTGADISEFDDVRATPEQGMEYDRINDETVRAIRDCGKPVCAAISGYCVGGGMSLALACDFRVASSGARIGITAGRLGLVYSLMDCQLLMEQVGLKSAKRILLGADIFDLELARSLGLIDLLAGADADARARKLLHQMACNAPLSQAGNKAILNAIADGSIAERRQELERMISASFGSEDYAEGRKAFAERRPAHFKGR